MIVLIVQLNFCAELQMELLVVTQPTLLVLLALATVLGLIQLLVINVVLTAMEEEMVLTVIVPLAIVILLGLVLIVVLALLLSSVNMEDYLQTIALVLLVIVLLLGVMSTVLVVIGNVLMAVVPLKLVIPVSVLEPSLFPQTVLNVIVLPTVLSVTNTEKFPMLVDLVMFVIVMIIGEQPNVINVYLLVKMDNLM